MLEFLKQINDIGSFIKKRENTVVPFYDSEFFFQAIEETIEYGLWICNTSGKNLYASKSLLRFTGLNHDACRGRGWECFLHPDDLHILQPAWKASMQSGQQLSIECRIQDRNGMYHPALVRGRPVYDAEKKISYWAGMIINISCLKMKEEDLKTADRHKDEFMATLGHEIRNLLAPIRTGVSVMNCRYINEDIYEKTHDMVTRQIDHLTRIIDDLFDISRIKNDKIEIIRQRINLLDVISNAIENSSHMIENHNHNFVVMLPDVPLYVDGDAIRLQQAFTNILNNAAKYTPAGGYIRLIAEDIDGEAVVTIEDNGIGISDKMLPHIFDMYTQGESALKYKQGGLGIGLMLVKKIIEHHGGRVEAMSEGDNKGSEFNVYLPLSSVQDERFNDEIELRREPDVLKFLIVDDSETAGKAVARILEAMGHETSYANNSYIAIRVAKEMVPDAVLIDLDMADINGYGLCEMMREIPTLKKTIFIAQASGSTDSAEVLASESGFSDHLLKPIDQNDVVELISKINKQRIDIDFR